MRHAHMHTYNVIISESGVEAFIISRQLLCLQQRWRGQQIRLGRRTGCFN